MTQLRRIAPLAALVLSALVLASAQVSSAAADPGGAGKASVTKKLKKLKKQVRTLQQQIEDLSKQPGPQGAQGVPGPATGPAGGDLLGTYPNPLIAPAAVGSNEIADNAVVGDKIADRAVSGAQIATDAVGPNELGDDSVGGAALKNVTLAVSDPGVIVSPGSVGGTVARCAPGQELIAGGYAWQDEEPNSILTSAPSTLHPDTDWVVEGIVPAGSNRLFAWAKCLTR